MKQTLVSVLATGVIAASGTLAHSIVGLQCSQAQTRRGPATGSVVLSPTAGSPLLSSSHGDATFRIQGDHRLGFSATDVSLVADRLPARLELALVEHDGTLAAGDMCSGIGQLVTKRLNGEALARVFGLPVSDDSTDRPQLVVRVPGDATPWMAGALGDMTLRRGGCGKLCQPALTASCRASCATAQAKGRCVRRCRQGGMRTCRQTGICRRA
jgi:hypothetical protein